MFYLLDVYESIMCFDTKLDYFKQDLNKFSNDDCCKHFSIKESANLLMRCL